ncbi:hypothetical protein PTKIN_Ptkin16aG0084500 [Pterospermum kingtungense]
MVFLATITPITFAARNEVVYSPFNINDVSNIRNPFANSFLVQKPAENCLSASYPCGFLISDTCCNGHCLTIPFQHGICVKEPAIVVALLLVRLAAFVVNEMCLFITGKHGN